MATSEHLSNHKKHLPNPNLELNHKQYKYIYIICVLAFFGTLNLFISLNINTQTFTNKLSRREDAFEHIHIESQALKGNEHTSPSFPSQMDELDASKFTIEMPTRLQQSDHVDKV